MMIFHEPVTNTNRVRYFLQNMFNFSTATNIFIFLSYLFLGGRALTPPPLLVDGPLKTELFLRLPQLIPSPSQIHNQDNFGNNRLKMWTKIPCLSYATIFSHDILLMTIE